MRVSAGLAVLIITLAPLLYAESSETETGEAVPTSNEVAVAQMAPSEVKESFTSRHFKFVNMESDLRFRYMDKAVQKITDRDTQHKISTVLQVNLGPADSTRLVVRAETGRIFSSSWDYNGKGLNKGYWSMNVKSFYLAQRLGRRLEIQLGGIEFDRGAGTEATHADNDGWLEGYRLTYEKKNRYFVPDKYSLTVGYVGDFLEPNFFERAHRMGETNYVQALVSKELKKNTALSAEFDSIGGLRYVREGIHARKLPLAIVDEVQLESIARISDKRRFGWSSTLSRGVGKNANLRLGAFYSDIPSTTFINGKKVVLLNGDMFSLGKRIGPTGRFTPMRGVEFSFLLSKRLDATPGCRYRGQVGVKFQFANLVNRTLRSF